MKPTKAAVLATAAISSFVLIAGCSRESAPAVPTNEQIDDSIVYMEMTSTGWVYYPSTTGWKWTSESVDVFSSCTGWFAGASGEIMTAGHCVDPESDTKRESLIRAVGKENGWNAADVSKCLDECSVGGEESGSPPDLRVQVNQPDIDGRVISEWRDVQVADMVPAEDGDLALLRANGLNKETPFLGVATEAPKSGEAVTAIGFPGVVDAADGSKTDALSNPSFKTGTVSSSQVGQNGVATLEINADVSSGMSGGPTINDQGEVIGVNSRKALRSSTGGSVEGNAFNFVTDTADLNRFLQKNGVTEK
ncbi:S1 family peptidase [Rhodococcus tibetensis]|uniref:Serine protease n=1 Tax=Rhodococcus tibetensis TaxID=2965064 RepID=A0ABT1QFB2_9NOCA|nr:serine protease [Rhodococcus sp. FXJ9.536]MCQ4120941.1 serine protease [Rhodococcus sp. FXJ9.536]